MSNQIKETDIKSSSQEKNAEITELKVFFIFL